VTVQKIEIYEFLEVLFNFISNESFIMRRLDVTFEDLLEVINPGFAFSVTLDLIGMTLLIFVLYYRRYHDKELVTAAALFNIFIFSVLAILSSVNFGVAAGFGLFAILALFTLRSEPLSKIEMTYFFGSVAIAVICSIKGGTHLFEATVVAIVVIGTYIIDHPRMLQSVGGAKVTLDRIDQALFSNPKSVRAELSTQLGVDVVSYQVLQLDYINEMVRLNVYFRVR
jgi:Domain of unknown function (DUF4956)